MTAKYSFNKFLRAFSSPSDAGARSVLNFVDEDTAVKSGARYLTDTLKVMTREQKRNLPDFSIETVKRNNGIFDTTELKFGGDEFADFSADEFMKSFGIKILLTKEDEENYNTCLVIKVLKSFIILHLI